ncbi:MAG: UDP-N-acetylmuramate dehydrogenase [Planctomycetota bacterium]
METIRTNVTLASMTSFGVGGRADVLYRPARVGDALKILDLAAAGNVRVRILGGGTNLLVDDDGVRGPVLCTRGLREIRRRPGNRIRAEAGAGLARLLRRAAEWGLGGLEHLASIPGTVGGAVRMNAGGPRGDMAGALESVEVASTGRGFLQLTRAEIPFGYRRSGLGGFLILAATFRLHADDPSAIRDRMSGFAEAKRIRLPLDVKSAGCFFRNAGRVPAGLLIDRAGMKGFRLGGAMVSPRHANFIVNVGGATSSDVLQVARAVRQRVARAYGVRLRAEVRFWKSARRGFRATESSTHGASVTTQEGGDRWW